MHSERKYLIATKDFLIEELPCDQGQGRRREELHRVQGKKWLHFAGAAMKRYPTSKLRETQVRW